MRAGIGRSRARAGWVPSFCMILILDRGVLHYLSSLRMLLSF